MAELEAMRSDLMQAMEAQWQQKLKDMEEVREKLWQDKISWKAEVENVIRTNNARMEEARTTIKRVVQGPIG